MRQYILIRRDTDPVEIYVEKFEVADYIALGGVEKQLREVVQEFLTNGKWTKLSSEALYNTNGYFNWGDAIEFIPDELWTKYGIYFSTSTIETIEVDQNESLINY